jgi:peptidoglycan hydrolase-like protein with peptidoglycan-binding domain
LWQKFLCWCGIIVKVDGLFGEETEKATKIFQGWNFLLKDGKVGKLTLAVASVVKK